MNFENTLNEVLEKIKKIEDYNSEKYNVEYAIVSFLTDKECPSTMLARSIIVRLSGDKDIKDKVELIINDCFESPQRQKQEQ